MPMMMTSKPADPPTPAERLAVADGEHDKASEALAAARQALEDLRSTIAKEREAYLDADPDERPSRERLTALERELPEAEELVERFLRAAAKAERRVREVKADVLEADAVAIAEETARRQARILELEPQREAIVREITEHSAWIANQGPGRAQQLRGEAWRLRA